MPAHRHGLLRLQEACMKYHGRAPGHVRETFCAAVAAFYHWERGEPEPTVEYEIHYVAHSIPISRACGLVWNCTDVLPSSEYR
jgi:hypothetical protein